MSEGLIDTSEISFTSHGSSPVRPILAKAADRSCQTSPTSAVGKWPKAGGKEEIEKFDQAMELAFFAHRTDDATGELAAGAHDVLPRIYRDAGWIVPQLLASLSRADSVYFDTVSQIRMGWWSRGRTVLLGDAAWCVTLFAGSGSSLAVAGADLLGSNLQQQPNVSEALRSWEAQQRPHVSRKQRAGRRAKDLFVPSDPLRLWLRQASLKAAASPLVTRLMERRHASRTR